MSRQITHLQEKTAKLSLYAAQTGLQINLSKTKSMHINRKSNEKINIDDQDIEAVEDFTYLGSILSVDNGAEKDIKSRLQKARTSFSMLNPVWRSNKYSRRTKLRIFKSNVLSVLLYGSECWRMTATDISKLETFQNKCLRQICKIFYPNIISNRDLLDLTRMDKLEFQIKKRRHRLTGHILRMSSQRIPKVALKWTPAHGKRNRGQPKTTWRRTMLADLKQLGLTIGEAEAVAKDRNRWRNLMRPLAPTVGT